jgi:hypothetical protein
MDEINFNKYDVPNSTVTDNIKIYTGTTEYSNKRLNDNIITHKNKISDVDKIFSELIPSTLTAKGKLTKINFNEEHIINKLTIPNGGYILKIGCNYGVLTNPNPDYIQPPARVRVSNRGRKPKNKPKSKRKIQGSGAYFSSQITFEIYNKNNNKIYKIKLFRNGGFQVPGVNRPDMIDLIHPIIVLRDYLRLEFSDPDINIEFFISVMRNYICRIKNTNLLIRLNDLETILKRLKDSEIDTSNPVIYLVDEIIKKKNLICSDEIKKYIGHNTIGIAEIQNNCERYFGLIIKFYRPVPWRMDKRTTIKVLRSGKINIDGGNSIEESYELYHWLENIFHEYSAILYDPNADCESDEYDIGSGESIYDSE